MSELDKKGGGLAADGACATPEGVASLLAAGDLKIELSTVQEETFYDQNEDVLAFGDGCYCNPGKSCC